MPLGNALSASDGEIGHAAALAGGGIALKSFRDVAADLAAGRLVRALPGWQGGPRAVHLLVPMRDFQPRRVTRLLGRLKAGPAERAGTRRRLTSALCKRAVMA